jgi:YjbE family integral membrane protein
MALTEPQFWISLLQIIWINIILSGDNAIVIAMACRSLPPAQQKKGIFYGSLGAIVLRIILTAFAVYLLAQPYLKLIGSALLMWIAVKLLLPDDGNDDAVGHGNSNLIAAIKTIIIADLVMSLDNVIGVAAAAKGSVTLLVIGLLLSMPLIIYGSTLLMKVMTRFPIIITLGGALLGYVAGEMAVTDPILVSWVQTNMPLLHTIVPITCAVIVVVMGKLFSVKLASKEVL